MKRFLTLIIIFAIIAITLNPIRIKYFTDRGKLSRYLLEIYNDIGAVESTIHKLKKVDIQLSFIQKNNGYKIYHIKGTDRGVHNDAITTLCIDNKQLYSGGGGGSPTTYSDYEIYGIKGNKVFTIEFLLEYRIINAETFFQSLKEYDDKNNTNLYGGSCQDSRTISIQVHYS